MRVIKRYSNRKLYDTEDKKYVTLDQIATLIRDGEDIKVVDNESGEDLTTVTLSQILVEQEKRKEGFLPKGFLSDLIKGGTTMFSHLRRTISSWFGTAFWDEETIEENIEKLVKQRWVTLEEGRKLKEELLGKTLYYKQQFDEQVEQRVEELLEKLMIPRKAEMETLQSKLDDLEERYSALLKQVETELEAGSDAASSPVDEATPEEAAKQQATG